MAQSIGSQKQRIFILFIYIGILFIANFKNKRYFEVEKNQLLGFKSTNTVNLLCKKE